MAPPPPKPKLRQSSISSFLFPHQNPTTPSPAATDDYERLRRETIGRNREFLRKLGIAAADSNPNPNPSKRPKKPPPPSLPLRRSARKRRPRPPPPSLPLRRSARKRRPRPPPSDAEDEPSDAEDEPSSVDSSVYRYACRADAPLPDPSPSSPSQSPNPPIAGFRIVGKAFRDPSLARIYSLDVFPFDEDRFLIAAGGHGGFISVYGGSGVGNDHVVEGEGEGEGDKPEMETELPLTSWKGSGSWISGVRFVEENPTLLLSSSNDGGIVVWDIKPSNSSSRPPPVVAKSIAGLHSGGIFAMDRFGCSIATASKDSSVAFSRLTPAGDLVAERNISGHHSGVIRGVCFREENTVADCGADGRICVLDTRSPHPCTLTVNMQHTSGINTVEWCKLDQSLLLSASKDPTLHLFDVRNPSRSLLVLQGHVESGTGTCRQICRPCFVYGGKAVATPGQGSRKISLFDVGKGKMISQGIIGFDANLVTVTTHAEQQRLWAAGRYINQLRPLLYPC